MKEIKIGCLPGKITSLMLNDDDKVSDAIEIAGLNPEGFEIRVNGTLVEDDTVLADGHTVLLTKKIKGN